MLRWVERALDLVSRGLAQLAALTLWTLTGFVVLSAAMRYFLRRPFNFTEELVALLFLATVFLALPLATVRREHISVPLLVNVLPSGPRRVAGVLAALVMGAFGAWFSFESWRFAAFSFEIGARSEQLQTPVGVWQSVMPLGIGLLTVIAVVRLVGVLVHGALGRPPDDQTTSNPL